MTRWKSYIRRILKKYPGYSIHGGRLLMKIVNLIESTRPLWVCCVNPETFLSYQLWQPEWIEIEVQNERLNAFDGFIKWLTRYEFIGLMCYWKSRHKTKIKTKLVRILFAVDDRHFFLLSRVYHIGDKITKMYWLKQFFLMSFSTDLC